MFLGPVEALECQVLCVMCGVSPATCHLWQQPQPRTLVLLTPPLWTSKWFAKTHKSTFSSSVLWGNFRPYLSQKLQILRPLSCHNFSLKNLFTMAPTLIGPWQCGHPVRGRLTHWLIVSLNRRDQTWSSPAEPPGTTVGNERHVPQALWSRKGILTLRGGPWVCAVLALVCYKLDGVAPLMTDPPPTSSTTLSIFLRKKKIIFFLLTCDRWHVTGDTWHVTHDMWHVWGGEHSLKISAP